MFNVIGGTGAASGLNDLACKSGLGNKRMLLEILGAHLLAIEDLNIIKSWGSTAYATTFGPLAGHLICRVQNFGSGLRFRFQKTRPI